MDKEALQKIEEFFKQFKYQKYTKGEIIIRADDDPPGVFYIKKGIVIEYLITSKGNEAIVDAYIENYIFPISWAVNNTSNLHYFEAIIETEVWRAPKDKFIEYIHNDQAVLKSLLEYLCEATDSLRKRLAYGMAGDAYARVVEEVVAVAKAIGIKDDKTGSYTINKLVERYTAARTGLTQETVSREMKKLKEMNLVTFHRNSLVVHDLKLLEKELSVY